MSGREISLLPAKEITYRSTLSYGNLLIVKEITKSDLALPGPGRNSIISKTDHMCDATHPGCALQARYGYESGLYAGGRWPTDRSLERIFLPERDGRLPNRGSTARGKLPTTRRRGQLT